MKITALKHLIIDHAITVLVTENIIMVSDQMAIFMILSRNKVYLKTFLVIYCKQGFLYMVGLQKTQQFEIHYTRLGTSINCSLHYTWIQYQVAHPELTLGYVNWGVLYPESSYKILLLSIMDP